MSSRTSPQTGVAIPYGVRIVRGIPTPVCALARNDTVFDLRCNKKSPRPFGLRDEFTNSRYHPAYPIVGSLFGLQQALSRNGGNRVPLLASCVHRTDSGIRSPGPSAPVFTNHRLSEALGKGKFSVNVFILWISVIKPQTGGFVNRQFLYFLTGVRWEKL